MAEQLDHYRLEEVIGVGSFALVYRAVDERLDSTVVVKMLAENHSLNPEVRERFIAEGRSLRRVEGSHVVSIYDIGQSERQQPYLVLEYADRGTLQQRITDLWNKGWKPTREDVLSFARPLAAAVDSVHRAQLVHRDLSPGNLLLATAPSELHGDEDPWGSSQVVGPGERLVIADLGMCKDLAMNSGLTVSGGTAGFRPPEQNGPGMVDFRADIWAMSAVLRWLVRESDLPANMSQDLHKVITRGMQTNPDQRQPDAATWLEEIEEALTPPAPPPPPRTAPVAGAAGDDGFGGDRFGADQPGDGHRPVHQAPEPESPPRAHPPAQPGDRTQGPRPGSFVKSPKKTSKRSSSPARRVFTLSATLVVIALVGFVTGFLLRGPSEPVSSVDEASISISGPDEIAVGEQATFTAEVEGAESWVWTLPTGRYVSDDNRVTLTPSAGGNAEVVLRARAPDGTELEAQHSVRVVE